MRSMGLSRLVFSGRCNDGLFRHRGHKVLMGSSYWLYPASALFKSHFECGDRGEGDTRACFEVQDTLPLATSCHVSVIPTPLAELLIKTSPSCDSPPLPPTPLSFPRRDRRAGLLHAILSFSLFMVIVATPSHGRTMLQHTSPQIHSPSAIHDPLIVDPALPISRTPSQPRIVFTPTATANYPVNHTKAECSAFGVYYPLITLIMSYIKPLKRIPFFLCAPYPKSPRTRIITTPFHIREGRNRYLAPGCHSHPTYVLFVSRTFFF